MSNVTVAISELACAGTRDASGRHRFRFVRIFPFNRGEAGPLEERTLIAISAARLTRGVPWLCVPLSRGICLSRHLLVDNSRAGLTRTTPQSTARKPASNSPLFPDVACLHKDLYQSTERLV